MLEKESVFDFLHGLNKDLDEVRGHLFGTKPFPSIKEAFPKIRREESRKRVMLNSPSNQPSNLGSQSSVLAVHHSTSQSKDHKLWCDHYNKPHHMRDTCWKLHGKPTN